MARTTSSSPPWDHRSFAGAPGEVSASASNSLASGDHLAALLSADRSEGVPDPQSRDIQLKNIVEQACLATGATGAAIALARGDELICRAATGATAPAVGVVLNIEYGLSAICVRTRQAQRCDDTEIDPRVNANACRTLGVCSVLVVPMVYGDFLLGILEIFSPHPHAFGDRDEQTVLALAFRVMFALGISPQRPPLETAVATPELSPSSVDLPLVVETAPRPKNLLIAKTADDLPKPKPVVEVKPAALQPAEVTPPPVSSTVSNPPFASYPQFRMVQKTSRDRMTGVLTTLVVAVALVLGWVLGHGPTGNKARQEIEAALSQPTLAPSQVQAAPAQPDQMPATVTQPVAPAGRKNSAKKDSPDGLVVYQDGKMIFRQPNTAIPLAALKTPVQLAPEVAGSFLTHRVEPDYPERARHQHIQGPVTLQATVSEDGSVQQLKVVSGDALLASAAIDAVRLWKFKPYAAQGRHQQFETRITVNFALPASRPVSN